jgi:dTDP-4-dehydrorhamnose 3,5-epimerase
MENPVILKSPVFEDHRGSFSPTIIRHSHKSHLYLRKDWVQTNLSINPKEYTFRGLHFQEIYPQSKLIKVVQGSIIDFAIDIRNESFGDFHKWNLKKGDSVYIPKGFAHGFITKEPNTIVEYLVDEDYYPKLERSINWRSVKEVTWEILDLIINEEVIINEKDDTAISLDDYRRTLDFEIKDNK